MNTLAVKVEPRVVDLSFTSDSLRVVLADGKKFCSIRMVPTFTGCKRKAKEKLETHRTRNWNSLGGN